MATPVLVRILRSPALSPDQRRQAAAALRAIGRVAPRPARSRYACETCEVSWSGPEAGCWSCGRPASHARDDHWLLHRLLLAPVTPKKAGPR